MRSRSVAWAVLIIILPMGVSLIGISIFRNYDLFHDRYLSLSAALRLSNPSR
jgi:hypothetical protein